MVVVVVDTAILIPASEAVGLEPAGWRRPSLATPRYYAVALQASSSLLPTEKPKKAAGPWWWRSRELEQEEGELC